MSDINCPYCGAGNDINHDDGFGYAEDIRHEMQCASCGVNWLSSTRECLTRFPKGNSAALFPATTGG
jgi:transposase-like protein